MSGANQQLSGQAGFEKTADECRRLRERLEESYQTRRELARLKLLLELTGHTVD